MFYKTVNDSTNGPGSNIFTGIWDKRVESREEELLILRIHWKCGIFEGLHMERTSLLSRR